MIKNTVFLLFFAIEDHSSGIDTGSGPASKVKLSSPKSPKILTKLESSIFNILENLREASNAGEPNDDRQGARRRPPWALA
jgi:hypothetical protein